MSRRRGDRTRYGGACAGVSDAEPPRLLAAIVRAYRRLCRPGAIEELESFRREPDLEAAVERAALAQRPDGKRYDHQRRLSRDVLKEVRRRLAPSAIRRCDDFDQLHAELEGRIGSIRGVGELMLYDTALRIGAKLSLTPTRVYLHAGTRRGARALGLNGRARSLDVSDLPGELRKLEPHEIEDCLCIFKQQLAQLRT